MKGQNKSRRDDLNKYVESKITINANYQNFLSSSISTKIDRIRQEKEKELNREYHQKFLSDRKRTKTMYKTLSTSKMTIKDKNPIESEQKRLVFDKQDLRQKYYEIHQKYLSERDRGLQIGQNMLRLKQALFQFLKNPSVRSSQQLLQLMNNQSLVSILQKELEWRQQYAHLKNTMREIMRILQIHSCQDILQTIYSKTERFKNLDECTFKILELEAVNKKIVNEFQEKNKRNRRDYDEALARQKIQMNDHITKLEKMIQKFEKDVNNERLDKNMMKKDLAYLIDNWDQEEVALSSSATEILEIHKIMVGLSSKLREIEMDAEENMHKLLKSNKEMVRLEWMMNQLKDDMTKQIEEEEEKNHQKDIFIGQLQQKIEQAEKKLQQIEKKEKVLISLHGTESQKMQDQLRMIGSILDIKDCSAAKVMLQIKQILQKNRILEDERKHLNVIISEKDDYIRALTSKIQNLSKSVVDLRQTTKTSVFEKQEYKFLLNNLRDQVTEMKKQHGQEKQRMNKNKEIEIINSHKDILESYGVAIQENLYLKAENANFKQVAEQTNNESAFIKKKIQHLERTLEEKSNCIENLMRENQKYKNYLKQIESSFKEVVELEENGAKKIVVLTNENEELMANKKILLEKNKDMENSNNNLIRERNELEMKYDKCCEKLHEMETSRDKVEQTNVEVRLLLLQKQEEVCRMQQEQKRLSRECKILKSSNEKLTIEINNTTKKLVNLRFNLKSDLKLKLSRLLEEMNKLAKENNILKQTVRNNCGWLQKEAEQKINQVITRYIKVFGEIKKEQRYQAGNPLIKQRMNVVLAEIKCLKLDKLQVEKKLKDIKQFWSMQAMKKIIKMIHFQQISSGQQKQQKLRYIHDDVLLLKQDLQILKTEALQMTKFCFEINFETFNKNDFSFHRLEELEEKISKQQSIKQSSQDKVKETDIAKLILGQDESSQNEIDNINYILSCLLQNEPELPKLEYWKDISKNYLLLSKKLGNQKTGLKLDLSSVGFGGHSVSSPLSMSALKDFELLGHKRVNTQPNDELNKSGVKDTNRSRVSIQNENMLLQKQNDFFKKEISQLEQQLKLCLNRNQELGEQLRQSSKRIISLENATSIKALENSFKKLLQNFFADNGQMFQQTCRIMMKILLFEPIEIQDFEEKMGVRKRKKRGSGLFSGLFKN